ncbi:MAG TPA: YMGG-like glycine zipper-containing protein, partial [Pyrinomonadaceae bacterium]|nr:YMGG-like glycine zipper-containing protein [Pyrinomonadaceae bacterium]
TVTSVYDKTSQSPDWNIVAGTPSNTGPVGDFVIPNNTGLVAALNSPISSRNARDGDRFSMTVTSPSQYDGAVIEGRVIGERSGVVSGRATLSFNFDTIRLRNGQTYRFAGIVEQVRESDGDIVSVNNEGTVRDDSQTNRTVTRAGIGAVLGAIIGAIAGGGSGAAIGAGVGAGAGAGTVVLQGRDNLELGSGTLFTITATSPANIAVR